MDPLLALVAPDARIPQPRIEALITPGHVDTGGAGREAGHQLCAVLIAGPVAEVDIENTRLAGRNNRGLGACCWNRCWNRCCGRLQLCRFRRLAGGRRHRLGRLGRRHGGQDQGDAGGGLGLGLACSQQSTSQKRRFEHQGRKNNPQGGFHHHSTKYWRGPSKCRRSQAAAYMARGSYLTRESRRESMARRVSGHRRGSCWICSAICCG